MPLCGGEHALDRRRCTVAGVATFRATAPASVLCRMSGLCTLSATGLPIACAAVAASSAELRKGRRYCRRCHRRQAAAARPIRSATGPPLARAVLTDARFAPCVAVAGRRLLQEPLARRAIVRHQPHGAGAIVHVAEQRIAALVEDRDALVGRLRIAPEEDRLRGGPRELQPMARGRARTCARGAWS